MTTKFSQFVNGNECRQDDIVVGLRNGVNTKFDFPGIGIKDEFGNYIVKWETVGSLGFPAINFVEFKNALSGSNPKIITGTTGADVNVGLEVETYGNGNIILNPAGTGYVSIPGTNALFIPSGTTGERPAGATGGIRFNSTTGFLEYWNGAAWTATNSGAGTVTNVTATLPLLSSGGVTPDISMQGITTLAQGDILYASAVATFARLAKNVTATRYLSNTGASNNPAWAQVDLTNGVTGVLPVANGGTGSSTVFTQGSVIFAGVAGVYSQDNANFFWDDTNNRLGIGTATPSVDFQVKKSTNAASVNCLVENTHAASALSDAHVHVKTAVGGGNPHYLAQVTGTFWSWGVDQADSNKWKLAHSASIGTNTDVTITTAGQLSLSTPLLVTSGGTGLATLTTAYGVVCAGTTATGSLQNAGAGTAGQVLTSSGAGALPVWAAGAVSALFWNSIAGTSQTAAVNNGYVVANAAQTTITLPAVAAIGDTVQVQGLGAGGWILAPAAGDTIHLGSSAATTSLTSANRYDVIQVVCIVANSEWSASFVLSSGLTVV